MYSELTFPYVAIDVQTDDHFWGKAIGRFTVSGVVQQDKNVLAFKYDATMHLPVAVNYHDEVKRDVRHFIRTQRQGTYGEYLHFISMLRPDATVTLVGKVCNSAPRLFLPQGMALQAGEFQTTHGFIGYHYQINPAYR